MIIEPSHIHSSGNTSMDLQENTGNIVTIDILDHQFCNLKNYFKKSQCHYGVNCVFYTQC